MTSLVRLRIALADQPGALAKVASAIAAHGGNITALDVHRSAGAAAGAAQAVDDVIVEFAGPPDLDRLRGDVAATGAGTLLSHQAAQPLDPVVAVLRRAATMVAHSGRGADSEAELRAAIAELCAAPVVWVSGPGEADAYDAGRFAVERGGAVAVRTAELPVGHADVLPGEAWLLAVPDPERLEGGRVVFVARSSSEFTNTEIARIEALMSLHATLAAGAG
jgi:ACT domain